MIIEISGANDDLVYWEIKNGKDDEYCVDTDKVPCCTLNIGGKLRIYCIYDDNGCWCFAPSRVDETINIPSDWTITVVNDYRPYCTRVIIDTGDENLTVFKEA